jgi:uncharacterized membrane protein
MVVSVRNLFVPTVSHTKLMHTKLRRTQSLAEVPYYVSAAIFCLTQILTYLLTYLLIYLFTYLLTYLSLPTVAVIQTRRRENFRQQSLLYGYRRGDAAGVLRGHHPHN